MRDEWGEAPSSLPDLDERKQDLAHTFEAAADHYLLGPAFSWARIGPTGSVLAMDLSAKLLALAELWRLVAPGGRWYDQNQLAAIRAGLLSRLADRCVTSIDYDLLLAVATRE